MKRLSLFVFVLALLLPLACAAYDDEEEAGIPYVPVPLADDLESLGQQAEAESLPIMLLVSQTECGYCDLLKAEIIRPMILSGEYEDKVLIRELNLDAGERVTDFNGLRRSSQDVAAEYRAWMTPTLLFLDGKGKQLVRKIRGVNTIELFSFYLDDTIDKARAQLITYNSGPK